MVIFKFERVKMYLLERQIDVHGNNNLSRWELYRWEVPIKTVITLQLSMGDRW